MSRGLDFLPGPGGTKVLRREPTETAIHSHLCSQALVLLIVSAVKTSSVSLILSFHNAQNTAYTRSCLCREGLPSHNRWWLNMV